MMSLEPLHISMPFVYAACQRERLHQHHMLTSSHMQIMFVVICGLLNSGMSCCTSNMPI